MRIYLLGFVASGKSTIGAMLADRLRYPFIDAGDIADQLSKSAGTHYDCCNRALMAAARDLEDVVVATGGYDARSIGRLDPGGGSVSIWLDADLGTIWDRLQTSGWGRRKLQSMERLNNSMASLRSGYEACTIRVDAVGDQDEVVQRILTLIQISTGGAP